MRPPWDLHYETMLPDRTNLLPSDRARALRTAYFLRLATVACIVLTGVILIHGALLVPSYLYAWQQEKERAALLGILETSLSGSEEREVEARIDTLAADAAYLARLGEFPKASATVAAVIALERPGIRLTGFSFARDAAGAASLGVSGIATSRESLRHFEEVVAAQPFVTSAVLPISAYARERDIDFTIVLSGPLVP